MKNGGMSDTCCHSADRWCQFSSISMDGWDGGKHDAEMFVSFPSICFSVRLDINFSPPFPVSSPLLMKMNRFADFALSTKLLDFSLFLSLII